MQVGQNSGAGHGGGVSQGGGDGVGSGVGAGRSQTAASEVTASGKEVSTTCEGLRYVGCPPKSCEASQKRAAKKGPEPPAMSDRSAVNTIGARGPPEGNDTRDIPRTRARSHLTPQWQRSY